MAACVRNWSSPSSDRLNDGLVFEAEVVEALWSNVADIERAVLLDVEADVWDELLRDTVSDVDRALSGRAA